MLFKRIHKTQIEVVFQINAHAFFAFSQIAAGKRFAEGMTFKNLIAAGAQRSAKNSCHSVQSTAVHGLPAAIFRHAETGGRDGAAKGEFLTRGHRYARKKL